MPGPRLRVTGARPWRPTPPRSGCVAPSHDSRTSPRAIRDAHTAQTWERAWLGHVALHDLACHVAQVGSDNVGRIPQWKQRLPRARQEGRGAAGTQGAEHVPRVRGDEPQLGRRNLELGRHEAVDLCGWLEPTNRVNGEAPFEVLADSGVLQLLFHGRRRRVGERDQPESGRSQLLESITNVGMRRQREQAA